VTAWWKQAQGGDSWKAVIKKAKAHKEMYFWRGKRTDKKNSAGTEVAFNQQAM
jgi:hypothetical protein